MKLKRFLFPIFLFGFVFQSCTKDFEIDKESSRAQYDSYNEVAFKWVEKQRYDSAFYYFHKSKSVAQSSEQVVYSSLQIASIEQKYCDFAGSEETVTIAFENCTNPIYFPTIYNLLGLAYLEQYNYDEALQCFDKCYSYSLKELDKAIVKNNISYVYLEKKEFSKAITILSKIITNDSLQEDKMQYAKALDNLGYAYFKTNNPKGIDYLKKSLAIRTNLKNDYELIASYMHMSEYYQNTDSSLALAFAQKAYEAAKNVNSPDDKIEALKFMIANSEPIRAKQLALQQISLTDSIYKVRQSAKNQFVKIKYDSKKAIEEKEHYKTQKEIVVIILITVTILSLFIILLVRYRNRQKLKGSVYATETRISKKIHDELANDVFQAMTFAETQDLKNPEIKETLLENLDTIYSRTRNISGDNSQIDTGENYSELLVDLLNNYSNQNVNVIVNGYTTIDWHKLKKETKIAVYRVLQELMVNMKKHSQSTLVIISFNNYSKYIEIKYTDNGKGISAGTLQKKGLQNAENRIHAINGKLTFENETHKGFRIVINIPK
jgi:signal transduction histidine kinase